MILSSFSKSFLFLSDSINFFQVHSSYVNQDENSGYNKYIMKNIHLEIKDSIKHFKLTCENNEKKKLDHIFLISIATISYSKDLYA